MTIRFARPPASFTTALQNGLASVQLAAAQVPGVSLLRTQPISAAPHEIYHLGLDAVTSGRGIDAAEPVAWRYVVRAEPAQNTALAAEVHQHDGEPAFAGLNEGPFVRAFIERVESEATDPEIQSGDFEPRLLRIPALYVVAAWLRDRHSGREMFIPLAPSNPAVTPGRRYSREQFEAALADAANRPERPGSAVHGAPGTEAP